MGFDLFGSAGQDAGNLGFIGDMIGSNSTPSWEPAINNFGGGSTGSGDNYDWGSVLTNEAPQSWVDSLPQQSMIDKLGGYGAVLPTAMKGLGTLFSMRDAGRNRAALQNLADQQQFYNNKLQESYNNPNAYLNSPEGRALRSQTAQAIARKAAAGGMRSQTGAQMNALNQAMMANLGNYRQGLAKSYDPRVAMALQDAIAQRSKAGQLATGLESLFNNPDAMGMIGKALPMLGGALGGLGGLASGALGSLGGLFGGSDSGPSIDIGSLAPSTYEFI